MAGLLLLPPRRCNYHPHFTTNWPDGRLLNPAVTDVDGGGTYAPIVLAPQGKPWPSPQSSTGCPIEFNRFHGPRGRLF